MLFVSKNSHAFSMNEIALPLNFKLHAFHPQIVFYPPHDITILELSEAI